ncbi:MAG TPA: tetratricopeptide repeat protein [Polyangiaceae bacterium]
MSSQTVDILRSELERLYSLEEMSHVAGLVGLAHDVESTTTKASFARSLAEQAVSSESVEALVDVVLQMRREVDPRLRDTAALLGEPELAGGKPFGKYQIDRKISATEMGVVYLAKKDGAAYMLKTLRREAARDKRAVNRFLTQNRLVATVQHEGLPKNIDAGEIDGTFYVAYEHIDAQPLASRFARTGPSHINELRPILRALLEPLAALHKAQLSHGDLKMDHALVLRGADAQSVKVVLIDFGGDRLRPRLTPTSGTYGLLACYGSPKTIAPEQVRGKSADARTDVYAFGAMLYELLAGKPVFPVEQGAADAAMAHLAKAPEPPSAKAPRGWVTKEVDAFVLSLLAKDPAQRPRDAGALVEVIDSLGKAAPAKVPAQMLAQEKVDELVDALVASPDDPEAAIALEKAVDQVAEPVKIADAFAIAADQIEAKSDEAKETKKSLLYRAARIFDGQKEKTRAEDMYALICELDPDDDVASAALEGVRKSLGKFDEIVEMLLARAEKAKSAEERARIMAEIGRTYATELNDPEQALVAYTQALAERPSDEEIVSEVERLAAGKTERWNEVLATITEAVKAEGLATVDKNALLARAARWYDAKVGRADTALLAYQQILVTEPASEVALEGLGQIYRKAQQWPELAQTLQSHADAMGVSPRARDLKTEAAEIFETRLNDSKRARDIYGAVLAEDPAHARAGDALARIAEREGDWKTLVTLLDRRAEARRGAERAEVLARMAEVYEDRLENLPDATRHYEAVLAIDPNHLGALKGLDRIFNRSGRYKELLENLERQVAVAATPRQKINLYERMAGLYDEEFLDHENASLCLENILALDGANDAALTALARHYRAQGKWEEVVKITERHAAATSDEARRLELMLGRARTLAEQVGSPERATRAYEQILEMSPGHAGALEALARLREMSGDANAALSAIEALAAKAGSPEQKAEQWMRAAKLLEGRGDRDGAIGRYKLALEANPKDAGASAALRAAYAARGDAVSVVELIEKELATAENNLAKARLQAELARLQKNQLRDDAKAEASAKIAFELDPSNPDAQLVLGDVAYESQRFIEACKYYESLVGRTTALPKEDGLRVLLRFIEASANLQRSMSSLPPGAASDVTPFSPPTGTKVANPRVLLAVETLQKLAPADQESAAKAAKAVFDFGDPATARKMYEDLFEKFGTKIVGQARAEALYGLGESARRTGDLDAAIKPLREAADADPSVSRPLRALAKVYEAKEDYKESIRIRRRRLEMASGQERFEILLEIGDLESQKLSDRAAASKTYATALEERPDDRKLLTRLMQLYSEEKDWRKLVEVVLRLADFVDDPKQRAKYMQTAATISGKQIGDVDAALTYYDRALEADPTLVRAIDEALELAQKKGDHDSTERYLKLQLDRAKEAQDRAAIPKILDQLGALYQKFLNEPEMAIDAFEAAQAFDPENKERGDVLAELYASDVSQYLDKAVKAQSQILRRNPYRVESYKLLRRLYTEARRGDAAWCLCQALAVLNLAEPDEERFYRSHRADNAAPAQAVMTDEDWRRLAHPEQDGMLTNIFAMIQPTIIRTRTQPLESLGYDRRYAIDPALHPYPVSQTLYYVMGVLGMQGNQNSPLVFQNPNDPSGLGFIHAHSPAIVLGRAAFEAQVPTQSMAFVAGRHLTYYRQGYYVRHLVPTGTGLKAWLFAAIKTCVPQFPVSADLVGPVDEAMTAMRPDFQGVQKERLASLVSKLIQTGASLDLKKWVASVDLTADRIGFLLAHDLQMATEVIRATEEGASVPGKERVKEAVLFSVSEEYFEVRQKLGIAVE